MPLTPVSGILGVKRAAHLLRRACGGGSIVDIEKFAAMTAVEAMDVLFQINLPNPPLPIDLNTGEEWITNGPSTETEDSDLMRYLMSWILGQMLAPSVEDDLKLSYATRERIIFFLHTLFTTKKSKAQDTRALYYQNALFRHYAFDQNNAIVPDPEGEEGDTLTYEINFKELTKKLSVENAMLVFLDGRLNVRGNPNENYARELLELYSIGRGLEGQIPEAGFEGDYIYYTEQDVQAGARVLSGFEIDESFSNVDIETGLPRGIVRGSINSANQHDNDTKQFSSRLGSITIGPDSQLLNGGLATEESALEEISQLIELIYDQDETAKHICRKLYRFYVYHEVDESIQSGMVQDLADVFTTNNFKITPVLRALFTSQEFYEGASGVENDFFGSIIKSPLDLVIGFNRNFGINTPDYETSTAQFYDLMSSILSEMRTQGMDFYEPFEVAGYSAYHQFPIYNRSWITTNYLTSRYNFISSRITPGDLVDMGDVNPYNFVRNNISDAVARNARNLIVTFAAYFLPMSADLSFAESSSSELSEERMNYFLDTFLGDMDENPETAWTNNWDATLDIEKADNQLTNLLNAMLQTPEYQLM